MKTSFGKLGRKLTMQKSDMKDHQASAHVDELNQASKDIQDMRNCYDGLLLAAGATANSIYEFSESLNEMGNCLLRKTPAASDAENGNVLSTLGNLQLELQKIADTYRSYVVVTITNPTDSLLSELLKVEEIKLQCHEKREVYDHMMAQQREKGKLKNGKVESSVAQRLKEAQDEYDEMARLCVFRVKSLKDGQWRSLLTQAARHHIAQLNFFRKGLKAIEAVEPFIRNVAEKHHIDCQLRGLYDRGSQEGEPMNGHESTNDGELSFDYKQKKQGLDDDDGTSPNPMELDQVDVPYFQASNLEDSEMNQNRHKGEQLFGRQTRGSSYSAPLYPEKSKVSEKHKENQPSPKSYSYVLPPPVVDTRNPISKPAASVSHSTPFQNVQHDSTSTAALASKPKSTIKTGNIITPSIQLPSPITSTGRSSFSQQDSYYRTDSSKIDKRQSYSGPLPPSKQFSFKFASNSSGPITSTELPQPPSRSPVSQPNLSTSPSPPSLSSPKISELHELPRPPPSSLAFSKPVAISGGFSRHSAPLLSKNQEISPPNKRAMLTSSTCASPLPLPPSVVKFSSSNSGT
ncbi:hypothetical protein M8C21_003967 [Ambrosia artemisiifolia]|uniref:BAR domain-containing protein n=1 Tax=Ambrosia artemisiifolia TaxID=4212 RepID=A0AAD5CAG0_AMBAR|nr:hypothetical protein M8C21_003967 [Ambrosia artemisiifolia]